MKNNLKDSGYVFQIYFRQVFNAQEKTAVYFTVSL